MSHLISQQLKGTGVALVTPFLKNKEIDFEGLTKLVNYQIGLNWKRSRLLK